MKRLKVLHLITTVEEGKGIGGTENLLLSLADKIDKSKIEFMVVYYMPKSLRNAPHRTKVEELFIKKGINVIIYETRSKFNLIAVFDLIKLIRHEDIDIVHSHQLRLDFWATIAARLSAIASVITRHQSIEHFPMNKVKKFFYQLFDRLVTVKLAGRIISGCRGIAEELIKIEKAAPDKITVIYNGIDAEKFIKQAAEGKSIREELNFNKGFLIGIIARIYPPKGHDYFLEAISIIKKRMPDVKSLIVGDGPLRASMEEMAEKLGLGSDVVFSGYRTDIAQIISELDVVVISSLTEGLSVTILEAMALGKPVVAFKVGGVSEVVEDGGSGILVNPKDSAGLAEAIMKLLKDKSRMAQMGKKAQQISREQFSLEKMAESYMDVYFDMLKL